MSCLGGLNESRVEMTGNGKGSGLSRQEAQEGGGVRRDISPCFGEATETLSLGPHRSLTGWDGEAYHFHGLKLCNQQRNTHLLVLAQAERIHIQRLNLDRNRAFYVIYISVF